MRTSFDVHQRVQNASFAGWLEAARLPRLMPMTTRHKRLGCAMAAALLLGLLPAAAAEAKATDSVELQNGGLVKGEILVMDPGEKVVIQVPGEDEPRTIPWSEVSDVQRGSDRPPPPPPKERDEEPSGKGKVRVHIEADDDDEGVTLTEHMRTGTVLTPYGTIVGVASNTICSAPCGESVDAKSGKMYTISGEGLTDSAPFGLDQYEGDVTLRVDGGSAALLGWGATVSTFGGLALIGGAVFTPIGVLLDDEDPASSTGADIRDAGIGMLISGAVVLTAGIVMMSQGGTDVEIAPRGARSGKLTPRPARWWRGEF
jgi:hypothetical protein